MLRALAVAAGSEKFTTIWERLPLGMAAALIVGAAVSVTVTVATELVTLEAPEAIMMARYCAPLSDPNRFPVLRMLLVAPAVGMLVQPPVALLVRCQR